MDEGRYAAEAPPVNKRADPAAWKAAIANSHAQLEHQFNRLINLELAVKFGPNAWRAHIQHLEATNARLSRLLKENKQSIDQLNRQRKAEQASVVKVGQQLRSLEAEWMELVQKNMDISAACKGLEAELEALARETAQPMREAESVR
eukprot:jgi/Chlat1/2775/Chrsp187S08760